MTTDRPRLFRLTVRLPEGKRRYGIVKCPYYERDPQSSLYGLGARLAELTLAGSIVSHSVSVPTSLTAAQRARLVRWPEQLSKWGVA